MFPDTEADLCSLSLADASGASTYAALTSRVTRRCVSVTEAQRETGGDRTDIRMSWARSRSLLLAELTKMPSSSAGERLLRPGRPFQPRLGELLRGNNTKPYLSLGVTRYFLMNTCCNRNE